MQEGIRGFRGLPAPPPTPRECCLLCREEPFSGQPSRDAELCSFAAKMRVFGLRQGVGPWVVFLAEPPTIPVISGKSCYLQASHTPRSLRSLPLLPPANSGKTNPAPTVQSSVPSGAGAAHGEADAVIAAVGAGLCSQGALTIVVF